MKRVYVAPGCISCGSCEAVCPEVFQVTDLSNVKPGVDLDKHSEAIKEAADICPVQVIKIQEK